MRITGGIFKGRKLRTVSGFVTRPTTDKIRQAIFNSLVNDIEGAAVLDLFSGSGALGIEAISRGADSAVFVESGKEQIYVIGENLKSVKLSEEIIQRDYDEACRILAEKGKKFDLIFADPPYKEITPLNVIDAVCQYGLLSEKGLLIIEHKAGQPTENEKLALLKKKKFGKTEISFFWQEVKKNV